LTATQKENEIQRTLNYSLDPQVVRPQDVIYIFRSIVQNPIARRPTYAFLKANWATIEERFSRGSISLLSSIVAASTATLTTLDDAADIRAFFSKKNTDAFSRTIEQSIEKITLHAKWLDRDAAAVADWLKKAQ